MKDFFSWLEYHKRVGVEVLHSSGQNARTRGEAEEVRLCGHDQRNGVDREPCHVQGRLRPPHPSSPTHPTQQCMHPRENPASAGICQRKQTTSFKVTRDPPRERRERQPDDQRGNEGVTRRATVVGGTGGRREVNGMVAGTGEPSAKRAKVDETEEDPLVRRREELILGVANARAEGKELVREAEVKAERLERSVAQDLRKACAVLQAKNEKLLRAPSSRSLEEDRRRVPGSERPARPRDDLQVLPRHDEGPREEDGDELEEELPPRAAEEREDGIAHLGLVSVGLRHL